MLDAGKNLIRHMVEEASIQGGIGLISTRCWNMLLTKHGGHPCQSRRYLPLWKHLLSSATCRETGLSWLLISVPRDTSVQYLWGWKIASLLSTKPIKAIQIKPPPIVVVPYLKKTFLVTLQQRLYYLLQVPSYIFKRLSRETFTNGSTLKLSVIITWF